MRFKNLSAICSIFIWTTVILAKTVSAEGNDANKVQELTVKSGFQREIEQLPNLMKFIFDARLKDPNIKPEWTAKVKAILPGAFNVQEMINAFKQDIDKEMSPQELDEVLAWLNSPLGMKITQLEESSSSITDLKNQMDAMKAKIAKDTQVSPRTEIAHQLVKAARLTDSRLQIKIEVLKVMAKFSDLVTGLPVSDEAALGKLVKTKQPWLVKTSNEEAFLRSMVIYQALSDNELLQYVNFYQTPAGQKYADVTARELPKIFSGSLGALGDTLVKELTKPNAP